MSEGEHFWGNGRHSFFNSDATCIDHFKITPPHSDAGTEESVDKARQLVITDSEACDAMLSKVEKDLSMAQDVLRQVDASLSAIVNDSQHAIPQLFEAVAEVMARPSLTPRSERVQRAVSSYPVHKLTRLSISPRPM